MTLDLQRGSLEQCIKLFFERAPDNLTARRRVQQFTHASSTAVADWALGRSHPSGIYRLRILYFLEANNLVVNELMEVDANTRSFGRLLAFGILDVDAMLQQLGYTRDGLFALLRGKFKAHPDKQAMMEEIFGSHHRAYLERVKKLGEQEIIPQLSQFEPQSPAPKAPTDSFVAVSFLHQVRALLPLATQLGSAGGDGIIPTETQDVVDLVTALQRLLGKK